MRYAHVFDGPGPDGKPSISSDHVKLDPELADNIASYLRSGTRVVSAPGTGPDLIDPTRRVELAKFTDGEWYWNAELIRYVGEYRLTPIAAFVDHVIASGFVPATPTVEQLEAVRAQLGLSTP